MTTKPATTLALVARRTVYFLIILVGLCNYQVSFTWSTLIPYDRREGGKFSGGFDINVFEKVHKTGDKSVLPDVSVDLVVNTIEDARKPSVAAIQGLALGGGLELALGCHARISAPKALLGLPELSLGVIPRFGGTQRLPRLVGVKKAGEMMLICKARNTKPSILEYTESVKGKNRTTSTTSHARFGPQIYTIKLSQPKNSPEAKCLSGCSSNYL